MLLERMEENEGMDRKEQNIALLHRVGEYYQGVGLGRNEYFGEECSLVLDLARECREEEFWKDHEEYLQKASQLLPLLPKEDTSTTVRLQNEQVFSLIQQNKLEEASRQLNTLLESSSRSTDLSLPAQLDVLLAKASLELAN